MRYLSKIIFLVFALTLPISGSFAGLTVGTIATKPLKQVSSGENFSIAADELDASTLSESRMLEIGLDLSAFNSPLLDYELDYIRSILTTGATEVSTWQSDLANKGSQEAAQWKLGRISDETDNSSELSFAMIDAAVGGSYSSNAIISARGETLSTIQTFWSSGSITTSSPASIKTYLATNATLSNTAFASANEADAYVANADNANFTVANFSSCFSNSDSITGGANTCSVTNAQWSAFSNLQTAVTDNTTANITKANLDAVFGVDNSSYTIDLSDNANLQYTQNCITGVSANSWTNIKSCVTAATLKVAAKWKVYQISLGTDNATHPSSDFTVSLYDRAVSDNGTAFLQDILDARPSLSISNLRTTLSSYFTANSITDQSSDNDFKLFPVHKAGFKDTLTSYNAWVNNSGFSVSTVDNASEDIVRVWEACRRSRDTTSGGSTTCTPSYSTWAARAAARAADDIYQVRTNDFQGPRVYLETLMGITVNLQNISTAYLTEFRWNDHTNGTQRQGRFGWTSSSGSYGFLNQDGNYIAESPPIGGLMEKL